MICASTLEHKQSYRVCLVRLRPFQHKNRLSNRSFFESKVGSFLYRCQSCRVLNRSCVKHYGANIVYCRFHNSQGNAVTTCLLPSTARLSCTWPCKATQPLKARLLLHASRCFRSLRARLLCQLLLLGPFAKSEPMPTMAHQAPSMVQASANKIHI